MPKYRYIDPDTGEDITDQVPSPTATPTTAAGGGAPPAGAVDPSGEPWNQRFPTTTPQSPYDVQHPRFSALKQRIEPVVGGALTALDPGLQRPPPFLLHTYSPQTWTQAAMYPLNFIQGLGEAGKLRQLAEAYPAMKSVLEPAAALAEQVGKSWWRRLGSSALTGYLTSELSGEPGRRGATEALLQTGTGEVARLPAGITARKVGAESYVEGVNQDVAGALERKIPGITINRENPSEITRGTNIVKDAVAATKDARNEIDQAVGKNKVTMPHIASGKDVNNPIERDMKLQKAEKQLQKLSAFIYGVGGKGKRNVTAIKAAEHLNQYRQSIADELDAMQPGLDIGKKWLARRNTIARAESMARLFEKNKVIDEATGKIDPTKWSQAVLKNWDDLVQHFGKDGAEDFLRAGGARRGMIPQAAEAGSVGFRGSLGEIRPHWHFGRTLRPPRTPENWMYYPPRGFLSLLAGQPAARGVMGLMPVQPADIPAAVTGTVPEEPEGAK